MGHGRLMGQMPADGARIDVGPPMDLPDVEVGPQGVGVGQRPFILLQERG